jgi:hypothetical protein
MLTVYGYWIQQAYINSEGLIIFYSVSKYSTDNGEEENIQQAKHTASANSSIPIISVLLKNKLNGYSMTKSHVWDL